MNMSEIILLGVISGVITSAFLYIVVLIFNKIVFPWYRSFVYKGVILEGTWEEKINLGNGNEQLSTIEIIQKAHSISGSATVVKINNGNITNTKLMYLRGSIKDRLFNATLVPIEKQKVGIVTLLLEVIGDGGKMSGTTSWYDANAGRICCNKSEWIRK